MANLDINEVYNAQKVLSGVLRKTPLIWSRRLNRDVNVYIKPENMQYTGSFKLRGAYYKISQLSEEEKSRGVVACSAGNHAQGVAFGASHNGIKALICLPAGAPISKVEATKGYGADVCLVPGVYDDAYAKYGLSIPFGLGVKFSISDYVCLGVEWGFRKTFTDYIDDISKNYVEHGTMINWAGELAAAAADRTHELDGYEDFYHSHNLSRGNPQTKDWYNFFGITLTTKLASKSSKCPGMKF
jgi:threonine dehydratase